MALSHYRLWKKAASHNKPTFIFEDDAIRLDPQFEEKVIYFMKELPDDWDIFLVGFWLHKGDDGERINNSISRVRSFVLLNSYVIHPRGAQKLLNKLPINAPVDTWISMQSNYINIYRHFMTKRDLFMRETRYPRSILVKTKSEKSQIEHTNNW